MKILLAEAYKNDKSKNTNVIGWQSQKSKLTNSWSPIIPLLLRAVCVVISG